MEKRPNIQMIPMPEMLLDRQCRFWEKVDVKSDSECWNWHGAVNSTRRGYIKIYYVNYVAHRIAYYIYYKKDPGKLLVCHECNNGLCMNPNHLFLGTVSDNVQHAYDTGIISQRGTLSASAKLLDSHIREIRNLQGTIPQSKIAKIYGVSPATISYILSGQRWTHVH